MRILLSAYAFSPFQGGEPAVGWNVATRLAERGHEVTVLFGDLGSPELYKLDLDRFLSNAPLPANLRAVHVATDPLTRKIHDWHALPGLWFLYYQAYRRWQQNALNEAKRLHQEQPFDLVHHLTIIGYREPGYLWQLGIPFFWGPLTGAVLTPWRYLPGFSLTGIYRHASRNFLNLVQMRMHGRCLKAARIARKIWTVTSEDRRMVEDVWGSAAENLIETGAAPCDGACVRQITSDEPLQLIWCGIVDAQKSLYLALHALAERTLDLHFTLHVIGEGPEQSRCQALAVKLGIASQVRWHGKVEHSEVRRLMAGGHALIHTGIKEGTPHVVLEALTSGLPILCHDACGMGVAVDDTSGLKVPLHDPQTSIDGFRAAIIRIASEPGLLERLSKGALARAQALSWDRKIDTMIAAYESVLLQKEDISNLQS